MLLGASPSHLSDDDDVTAWQQPDDVDDTPPEQDHAIMAHTPTSPALDDRPLTPTDFTLDAADEATGVDRGRYLPPLPLLSLLSFPCI